MTAPGFRENFTVAFRGTPSSECGGHSIDGCARESSSVGDTDFGRCRRRRLERSIPIDSNAPITTGVGQRSSRDRKQERPG